MNFTAMSLPMWGTLFAGLGGVVTLLYLLRLRRRRLEVPFGPLWQKVLNEKQTTSLFQALKRLFSLLVQLAVLALVLTAIADPVWTGQDALGFRAPREPDPRHTLLVVDTSASMGAVDGGKGRLERAVAAAGDVVDAMAPGESILLAALDRDVRLLTDWTRDTEALHAELAKLAVRPTGTDAEALMAFARNAVRGLPNPQVVLVTDRAFAPPDAELARAIHLRVVPVGADGPFQNVAVLDFNVRSHLGNTLKYAIFYRVKNLGTRPADVSVFLYSDASGTARTRADFDRLGPVLSPMRLTLQPGEERVVEKADIDLGGNRAALVIKPTEGTWTDPLAAAAAAFAVVPVRKTVKVLLVGRSDNLFLDAVLQTRSHVEVSRTETAAYTPGMSAAVDLTVFDGVAPPATAPGSYIYVNASGENAPFAVTGTVKGGTIRVPSSRERHPLMRYVRFTDLAAAQILGFKRSKGDLVMARTSGGRPAILARSTRDKRWVAVGFDPIATEWVGHYSFSIFFVNAINWFFAEESHMLRPWSLAQTWDVRLPWKGATEANVVTPSGQRLNTLVDPGGTLVYTGAEEGIYTVSHPSPRTEADKRPILVAAALRSPAESDLRARGDSDSWTPPPPVRMESPELRIAGASLWQILVLVAMGILLLEWFTYHRRWTV